MNSIEEASSKLDLELRDKLNGFYGIGISEDILIVYLKRNSRIENNNIPSYYNNFKVMIIKTDSGLC